MYELVVYKTNTKYIEKQYISVIATSEWVIVA
jgi:hypothetical protein